MIEPNQNDQHSGFAAALNERLSRPRIPALNGIRAIAVSLVILYHLGLPVHGEHGVLIFFVLSGFLITWLLLRENDASGTVSLRGFYRRRTLRIFPAFYAYWFAAVCLLLAAHKPVPWPHAFASFFYVSNYYNALLGDPNTAFSHTWSLAIEEQFYLLWPLAFVTLRRNLRTMTIALSAVIGAVWIYRAILFFVFHVHQAYFYASFDTRLDSLMVGCLLAVLLKRGVITGVWQRLCSTAMSPLWTAGVLAVSVFAGPAVMPRYRDVIGLAIDPVIVAVLIVQLIALSSRPALRWLDSSPMRFLGDISYPLYLWQQLTVELPRHMAQWPMLVQLSAAIALTIVMATLSYYLVERPFLRLKTTSWRGITLPATWECAIGETSTFWFAGLSHGSPDSRRSPPMHISLVAASPRIVGGQSVQAQALAIGLCHAGHDVRLMPIDPRFPRRLERVRRWPYVRTVLNEAMYIPRLRALKDADVVHVFSASYCSFLLAVVPAIIAARRFHKPVVLHYHSGEAEDHLAHWGALVHPWLRLVDTIVVPSEYLRGVFARHGYLAHVVPNVVDTSRFQYRPRVPLGPRLVSTRNLEAYYRVDNTIAAFAMIQSRHRHATLTIAGDGSERDTLRRLVDALGLAGVRFVGRVEPDAMPALLDDADLFVNSSTLDNQPVSVLEAFAAGLPVVSTPAGDIAALVRDNQTGLLVPPDDPAAMARAVTTLLEHPGLARRLACNARGAVDAFTWNHVRDQWATVYAEACA